MKQNVPISSLTTMRLGGEARFVQEINKLEDIDTAYQFAEANGLPAFVLGSGANTIGRDEGYKGVILLVKLRGVEVVTERPESIIIKAYAGEILDNVVKITTSKKYSGIEALSAIPGTVGAAPVQNIGAYGQQISDVITEVEVYDTKTRQIRTLSKAKCNFGYRESIFNKGVAVGRYFIIAASFNLAKGQTLQPPFYTSLQKYVNDHQITDFSPENIRKMVAKIRSEKLPDPKIIASSGSFFKNVQLTDDEVEKAHANGIPVWQENGKNVVNSGWLIEQAGLKGKEFYGMRVSDKAALILINEAAKSYADLSLARAKITDIVWKKFGFVLEQEPVEIK
ncbi:MAG: UDP-N-acetylmuramate dehydrogenase [Candidatus Nomurabacteria bacterium]|jgi:UDP-N-acetylmuramate dehydrogenase|nr:UDP-N-acetylmuramate dehydrogenase [Candidatus Nomurabacteria bacterium]